MKKIYILLCAMAALAAASCTEKEEFIPTGEMVTREFTTLLTKTTLADAKGVVHWEANDAISVFDGNDNNKFDIKNYTGPSASFIGEVVDDATYFYAVYPYAEGNSLNGSTSTLTAEVPAEQTLKAGSFQSGAAVAVAYTEGTNLAFHQATAVLGITLADYMTNVDSIMFSGNKGEYVAGKFSIKMDTSDGTITSVDPGNGSKKVVLTGTFKADQTYYLSFIPQEFSDGLTVTVFYGSGQTAVATSDKTFNTERGMIYPIANFVRVKLPVASVAAITSFKYGTAQDIPVTLHEVTNVTVDSFPEGWDVAWKTGHFAVTPPTLAKIQETPQTVAPAGVIKATISNDKYSGKLEVPVRLYGINSLDDLKALQDDEVMDDAASAAPYLVKAGEVNELTLNTDLTLQTTDLKSKAIALHHNAYPINGNGRTVTYDNVTVTQWPTGFVQNLQNDVHDINFTGSMKNTCTATDNPVSVGALAARGVTNDVVVTNVNSSVDIEYTASSCNAFIGGLVGYMATANKSITFDGCTVSGDIVCNTEVTALGGIIGRGEIEGTVSTAWTSFNDCEWKGSITYHPDATQGAQKTRIGGIIGNTERQLRAVNTHSNGIIDVYLDNKVFGSVKHDRAIGGWFGRSTASAAGHYMAFYIDNVTSSTNINVHGCTAGEKALTCFQIRGYALCSRTYPSGVTEEQKNIVLVGSPKITYDVYTAPEINGVSSPVSFSYGEKKNLDVTTGDLIDWTVTAALEGWTVNTDHIADGTPYITVTAPTQDAIKAGSAVGAGDIAFTATHTTIGAAPAGGSGQAVRLYGINNKAEFNAFKAIYTPKNDTRISSGFDDYLVSGKITLNADLSITTSDLFVDGGPVYVIKFLYDPLEGNNRTITYDVNSEATIVGFFQGVKNDVSNLNFAGTIKATNKAVQVGALASRGGYAKVSTTKDPTVLTNVNSSTHIIYAPTEQDGKAMIGGLIGFTGQLAGGTQIINDCTVSGIIENQTYAPWAMGGLVGSTGTTVDPLTDLNNCTFSGTINYSYSTNAKGSRVGGMIGENGRQATIDDCKFSGQINAYMNSSTLPNNDYGIGGVVGRTTNSATGYTMKCHITNYTYSGTITAYDAAATTRIGTCIGTDAGHPVTLVDGVRPLTTVTSYNFPGKTIQTASSD